MPELDQPKESTKPKNKEAHSAIVRHSAVISLFNGLGVLGGLVLDMVVAALFGLGQATDGFFLAFTVPQFVMLVLQGSFVSGLVPVLTGLQDGESTRAWTVFSCLLNLSGALLVAISALGWLAAGWITGVVGAGLELPQRAQAVSLARILFLMLPPLGLAEVMRAQLNAMERFAVPAAGNVVRHMGALATLLLGYHTWGIRALAFGYVVGALAQMVLLAVAIAWAGGRYRFSWSLADPDVREGMRLLMTRAGGIGLRRSVLILERFLASFLPAGSVTALSYARRISLSLFQVFANSVSAAILPALGLGSGRRRTGTPPQTAAGLPAAEFYNLPGRGVDGRSEHAHRVGAVPAWGVRCGRHRAHRRSADHLRAERASAGAGAGFANAALRPAGCDYAHPPHGLDAGRERPFGLGLDAFDRRARVGLGLHADGVSVRGTGLLASAAPGRAGLGSLHGPSGGRVMRRWTGCMGWMGSGRLLGVGHHNDQCTVGSSQHWCAGRADLPRCGSTVTTG